MPQIIRGLPASIATIPDDATGWLRWREQALAFREWAHRVADDDPEKRAAILRLAADDPAFFMLVYGSLLEPRTTPDTRVDADGNLVPFPKPQGWYPWVPYPFQVEMIRWIEDVMARPNDPLGRGDGVIEKSRDMGATWVFCLYVAHQWLFADDFVAGLISHKEDLVDSNDPKSMFFRIEALLGMNTRVPERAVAPGTIFDGLRVRTPAYLMPAGYEPKLHNLKLNLIHPSKSNFIVGESTTAKSGIGSRTTMSIIDEAAKIADLLTIWSGMGPVTSHRFALSSAERDFGDGMYTLVERGRQAQMQPGRPGPSFLSLPWDKHPLRDGAWYTAARNRYEGNERGFRQEYEIDWYAGMGDAVYPAARTIMPVHAPYEPLKGEVWGTIDPGLRDPTAVAFLQHRLGENRYRLVEGLMLKTPSAEYLAPILMGFPRGHPVRALYNGDPSIEEVMDFTWELRKSGVNITWVGDPYGDNAGGAERESYYMALFRRSQELNQQYTEWQDEPIRPVDLIVMTKYDEGARSHRKRKECLAQMLPRLDFHDIPRCRFFLEAVQSYRYKTQDEGRLVMNEPNAPAHDIYSHCATALEFWAVLATVMDYMRGAPTHQPARSRKKRKRDLRPDPPGFRRVQGAPRW